MNEEYLDVFVREGEAEITDLNNLLLALEEDPDDREVMDGVFRSAHTLKGNFAAVGYEGASDLAHAIEDLLDAVRHGELEATPELVDLTFAGVDELEAMLGEVDREGEVTTDPTGLIEEIREVLETGSESDECGDTGDGRDEDDANADGSGRTGEPVSGPAGESVVVGEASLLASVDTTERVDRLDAPEAVRSAEDATHLRVELAASDMKGADGMLLLQRLSAEFDLLGSVPDPDAVADGAFEGPIDVFLGGPPEVIVEFAGSRGSVAAAAGRALRGAVPEAEGDGRPEADRGDGDGERQPDAEAGEAAGVRDDSTDAPVDGSDGTDGDSRDLGRSDEGIKSVNVDVERLDELYGLVEQLVTSRIRLRSRIEGAGLDAARDLDELDKTTASLQDTVMDMRLVPMRKVVGTFPRVVRDIARAQDKRVDLEMTGTDVELDRTILDRLRDPLVHVLRNAVDHGIEPPDEREAAGKPPEGTVELRARRERDQAIVEVVDDGRGLDVEAIRRKAREQGIRPEGALEAMADDDVYDLVFHPGFSTTEEVTEVSGRGVGMDVVHSTVSRLDGSVDVSSTPGEGTTVRLELPVSIAIVKVLFVSVGDHEYGIPIKKIDKVTRFDGAETVSGEEFVESGDGLVPVVRLAEALDVATGAADPTENAGAGVAGARSDGGRPLGSADTDLRGVGTESDGTSGMLVRIRRDERPVALHCDAVDDQEEVVVKPLEGVLSGTEGISGTAVLGEGNVVPIIDVVTV